MIFRISECFDALEIQDDCQVQASSKLDDDHTPAQAINSDLRELPLLKSS